MNLEQIFEKQVIYHCTTNFRSNYQYMLKNWFHLKVRYSRWLPM